MADDPIALGEEPMRYYELATADHEAEPSDLDPALLGPGAKMVSAPLLPMAPTLQDAAPALAPLFP